ncbi:hypothetical protein CUMW_030170 [Citrus unshiu]|nr:hypothetical protein CUMW_030170 [Citrus unshiu]
MARLIFHSSESSPVCVILSLLLSLSASGSSSNAALFIFGDSTVDPGNNNYIKTTSENQANYKPYGQNGFFDKPTGRFSDGRVIVIDLPRQLENFEVVQKSLVEKLGEAKASELISEAVYFISIGSNDYMGGYLGNPKMQEDYNPETYVGMVIGNLTQAIQVLYEKGGRKFAFLSLSPLGCLPALRALNPDKANEGGCFEAASALALAHNNALTAVLTGLEHILKGFKYCNSNFYSWLDDRITHPAMYGFKDGANACCGYGPYRGIFTCGGTKNITEYELCEKADDHVWWDAFHPTERIHEQFAKALWNGPPSSVGPYNVEDLFLNRESRLTKIADIVDGPDGNHFQ